MSKNPKGTSKGISLAEVNSKVAGDQSFAAALKKVDPELVNYCQRVLDDTFPQYFKAEKGKDKRRFDLVKDVYFSTAALAMRHLDETGVTAAIGKLAVHLSDFSFQENAANLGMDHIYLTKNLAIPENKVQKLWPYVDQQKAKVMKMISAPNFSFEATVEPAKNRPLDSPGIEEWQRLSPGVWLRLAGYGLGLLNVGGAISTLGVGTGLAVASVITGAAAVASGDD